MNKEWDEKWTQHEYEKLMKIIIEKYGDEMGMAISEIQRKILKNEKFVDRETAVIPVIQGTLMMLASKIANDFACWERNEFQDMIKNFTQDILFSYEIMHEAVLSNLKERLKDNELD